MPLYKYLKKPHAELLLTQGKLRLGTLYEYRDTETHGVVIGDKDEGKLTTFMDIEHEHWTAATQPELIQKMIKLGEGGTMTVGNLKMSLTEHSEDLYIYCTTEVFAKSALADFGYDCCVVIERPEQFFDAISRTVRHKARFGGVYRCEYVGRSQSHENTDRIHPAITKDPTYQNQKEVRALWKPVKKTGIAPLIIECRNAAKYCSMHYRK